MEVRCCFAKKEMIAQIESSSHQSSNVVGSCFSSFGSQICRASLRSFSCWTPQHHGASLAKQTVELRSRTSVWMATGNSITMKPYGLMAWTTWTAAPSRTHLQSQCNVLDPTPWHTVKNRVPSATEQEKTKQEENKANWSKNVWQICAKLYWFIKFAVCSLIFFHRSFGVLYRTPKSSIKSCIIEGCIVFDWQKHAKLQRQNDADWIDDKETSREWSQDGTGIHTS